MSKKIVRKRAEKVNKKNRKPMTEKEKKVVTALLAVAFTALLTLVIISVYLLVFMTSYVNGEAKVNIEEYKENQAQTTIIYAYDVNNEVTELTRLHGEQNRVWVSLDTVPKNLQHAYVALEDKRFYKHDGVDWKRTIAVVVKYRFKQGGSTLTQQLIKNLTGENGRTINRKFYEILNALNLEKNTSKETILEAYLNTVYMSHGCYGVKTASEKYFGKDVTQLNLAECAALASITQAPSKYDPLIHPEENKKRQTTCLDNMLDEKYITQEEYDEAIAYEMVFTNSANYVENDSDDGDNTDQQQQTATVIQSYYVDYVIQNVINDLVAQNGYTKSQASKLIYNGGLRIYSAVDINIQTQLEDVYVNRISMPAYNKNVPDAQSAMTIMDYSGRILGIVGGVGEKTENRGYNRADRPRQPGSSIKPLSVYSPAIEEKFVTYSTKVENYGIMIKGELWPQNYGGDMGAPNDMITVQRAIAVSYNTVPARLVKQMGMNTCYEYISKNFHLSTVSENDIAYAPLAVGALTQGVTTVDMAAAFATFGNGGLYFEPYCYYKVTNSNGTKIYLQHAETEGEQAISADTADIMNELLKTVITDAAHQSTGRKYGISGFETFAKTGTTTDDKDRWFCGGTPYYVAAVWYGCDMPKQLSAYVSDNPAGKIFDEVMTRIHKGLATKTFTKYSPLVTSKTYCVKSGLLASDHCTETAVGWYSQSNMPGYCVSCSGGAPADSGDGAGGETTAPGDATPAETTTAKPAETTAHSAETTAAATGGAN